MVLEVALLDVVAGAEQVFPAAYAEGKVHLASSPGCRSVRMTQGVETPTRFILMVEWDSIEAHDAFRASGAFSQWRAHVGPHFDGPPRVEHFLDL